MNPVASKPRTSPVHSRGDRLTVILAIATGAALFMAMASALRPPPHVHRIDISNPHEWNVEVGLTRPIRNGALPIGRVERNRTESFWEVLDQGDTWSFQFTYGGVDGGRLLVSRSDLQRSRWKITVADEFAQRMRTAGQPPSG